ncbi:MAG: polyphenol oxidase family protein [Candidatus Babeliales bacterium]
MLVHHSPLFTIYFGDERTQFNPRELYGMKMNKTLLISEPFGAMQKMMHLDQLLFVHQVHGSDGIAINSKEQAQELAPFSIDSDYMVSNVISIGLAIATADCLSIILFDKVHHAVGIVHAGWRGTVKGVAREAVKRMQAVYGTRPEDLMVFFGPSAKACCYKVGQEVLEALESFAGHEQVLHQEQEGIMFDVPLLNRIILEELGVRKDAFHLSYNVCTLCSDGFCSYRKSKGSPFRQMTIVALK